jgi:hypothetical protein
VDKKAIMLRLYNASAESQKPGLTWKKLQPKKLYWSNANQEKLQPFNPDETWPPFAFKTLYLEL